jgi:hypothetical protein
MTAGMDAMMDLAYRQPLDALVDALLLLDAEPRFTDAERMTRAVLMDVICIKCPAAEVAADTWVEDENSDPDALVDVIAAAATPRPRGTR